jgi:effector-binding domain-containing protein
MTLQVRVGVVEPIPLAVVRRRARPSELATVVPQGCGVVWEFARARQLPAGRHVAIYLNADIAVEVGVELAGDFEERDGVVRSATPGGLAASAVHLGPYQELGRAHAAIHEWCGANGYRVSGPNWEIYGHWLPEWNADPSQIRTDIFYQVAPVGSRAG